MLLQIEIEVWSRAELKNCAETIMIDFDSVVLFNDSAIVQVLVNLIFSEGMLDVTFFDLLSPTIIEMMNLASNFTAVLKVISLVYL
jgi:hypothetical protein